MSFFFFFWFFCSSSLVPVWIYRKLIHLRVFGAQRGNLRAKCNLLQRNLALVAQVSYTDGRRNHEKALLSYICLNKGINRHSTLAYKQNNHVYAMRHEKSDLNQSGTFFWSSEISIANMSEMFFRQNKHTSRSDAVNHHLLLTTAGVTAVFWLLSPALQTSHIPNRNEWATAPRLCFNMITNGVLMCLIGPDNSVPNAYEKFQHITHPILRALLLEKACASTFIQRSTSAAVMILIVRGL